MKNTRKRGAILLILAILALLPAAASAEFGGGVVFDPTNYKNALLRYIQLQRQLAQLIETYRQVWNHYQLALRMSQNLLNMPDRYRATFTDWRAFTATDLYGNTTPWVGAVNGSGPQSVGPAYQQSTIPLLPYAQNDLRAINAQDARTIESTYASLELTDGANVSALTTVGNLRANAQLVQQRIGNLEQDSLSDDPDLNTEVGVLNKINASNVLTLRTLQDANNLGLATLEQHVLEAKRQRDSDAANLNFAMQVRQQSAENLNAWNRNLSESLGNYRLP
jgi:hypothetical protein